MKKMKKLFTKKYKSSIPKKSKISINFNYKLYKNSIKITK